MIFLSGQNGSKGGIMGESLGQRNMFSLVLVKGKHWKEPAWGNIEFLVWTMKQYRTELTENSLAKILKSDCGASVC